MVRLMSCERKKYHIDEEGEARGVTLCVGWRVHFISALESASPWYIMHDTCVDSRANKQQNIWEFLAACHAAEISSVFGVAIISSERLRRGKKIIECSYSPQCTL